jgi:hypothetical protein
MCDSENCRHLSRRGFATLALAAAGATALPLRAGASGSIEALGLTCIDYRLVDDSVRFFDSMHLTNEYDLTALAGASLAAVSPKFPSSNAAFWDHVGIAKQLHHIKKVIVVDHRDCGAYKVAFGKNFAGEKVAETAQHKAVMLEAQAMLKQKYSDLSSEFYLMALDGTAERVV